MAGSSTARRWGILINSCGEKRTALHCFALRSDFQERKPNVKQGLTVINQHTGRGIYSTLLTSEFKHTALALYQLFPLKDLFRQKKEFSNVKEFFSALSTEGFKASLKISCMHTVAHISHRGGMGIHSLLDRVPENVLSYLRVHRLAKDSEILCSYKLPNRANAFPHSLTCKPILATGDFGEET